MRILLECCLLSCVVYVDLLILFFLVFLPFFDFDLDIVCFFLSFSCGCYAFSTVSVFGATLSAYDLYTYVRWSHLFISVCGIRFVSVIVRIIFCISFVFILTEVIFLCRVIAACPVRTDGIVAMSYCENKNRTILTIHGVAIGRYSTIYVMHEGSSVAMARYSIL